MPAAVHMVEHSVTVVRVIDGWGVVLRVWYSPSMSLVRKHHSASSCSRCSMRSHSLATARFSLASKPSSDSSRPLTSSALVRGILPTLILRKRSMDLSLPDVISYQMTFVRLRKTLRKLNMSGRSFPCSLAQFLMVSRARAMWWKSGLSSACSGVAGESAFRECRNSRESGLVA